MVGRMLKFNLLTRVSTIQWEEKFVKYPSFIFSQQKISQCTKPTSRLCLHLNKPSQNKFELIRKKLEGIGVFQKDIEESFVKGTGKGGQKVNKTNNCVMIRYDSGEGEKIVIKCHKYRCLQKNRIYARELLYDKITSIRDNLEDAITHEIEKEKRRVLKPTDREKRESINYKKRRSEVKNNRQKSFRYEDDIG
ncbi:polypeptide chain release factor 2 [Plasmodium cynomolgi strain B]|uniref:Polypeptide chain release factor 2 n=1 Tax=Plasmodium cynomolgi (strain B) TaxID=1120755 RepID=K6UCF5_PLACD|nr:polypeptide chain release factor 2 [Plasmodium cynomolgi strain B]GAB64761.1 polypeptide chain release factor 2 [Plasmodium cynomolgi strain B]